MNMTKFTSSNDADFINLKGVLEDWIQCARTPDSTDAKTEVENNDIQQ
jgi:hypothetical protein